MKVTANTPLDPAITWQQRFRAPTIQWATIAVQSPDRGLACTDRDGVMQLYAWDVSTGALRPMTDHLSGVINGLLSAEGGYVYYLQDEGGNEIGHYVRVPFDGGPTEDVTPDLPPYSSYQINQSYSGNMVGARVANADGERLIVFAPGEASRQIYSSHHLFFGPAFNYDGDLAVIAATEGTGSLDTRLLALDVRNGELVAELWDGAGVSNGLGIFAPLPGDGRLLATTTRAGYTRPIIWTPRTGERRELVLDDLEGDIAPWNWSRDAARLLLSQIHEGRQRLYTYEMATDSLTRLAHPPGVLGGFWGNGFFTDDGEIFVTWQDAAQPSCLVALDGRSGKQLRTVLSAGDVPTGRPWHAVAFPSEHGATIHGWLAVPEGAGPFPTILHTHGGPTAVMLDYYSPESQAWLDHGFAFCTINYHGSTTFGKTFEKSIVGRLGDLEVSDMAAAYHWLVENGVALPESVFLTGDSYGGYLTLQALGTQPELWAGGMAGVAIADWALMYEDENDASRSYHRAMFGGAPDETVEAHRRSSPITYAERVQAPILIIQGRNDTRCPARQMEEYIARLKALNKRIEVHWFDAGHAARAQEQKIEHQALKLAFAHRLLDAPADGATATD